MRWAYDHHSQWPTWHRKVTLAEAWAESIEQCVVLDGDHLIVANPLPADVCAALAKNRVDSAALPI